MNYFPVLTQIVGSDISKKIINYLLILKEIDQYNISTINSIEIALTFKNIDNWKKFVMSDDNPIITSILKNNESVKLYKKKNKYRNIQNAVKDLIILLSIKQKILICFTNLNFILQDALNQPLLFKKCNCLIHIKICAI